MDQPQRSVIFPARTAHLVWTFVWSSVAAVVVWVIYGVLVFSVPLTFDTKGLIGDAFGALSSLFAGLAFAGLLVTIFLQSR